MNKHSKNCFAEPEGEATNLDAQVAERLYICIYVYMSVTVSYGHLGCDLEIVSVAIPMASSCSIYLYNVLNSLFRLLLILRRTCGSQFGERLRQSVCHFLLPDPAKIPPVHGDAGQNGVSSPKRVPDVRGSKTLGSEKTFDCAIADAGYIYTSYIYVYSSRYIRSSMVCLR